MPRANAMGHVSLETYTGRAADSLGNLSSSRTVDRVGADVLSLRHSHSEGPFEDGSMLPRWFSTTSHAQALPEGRKSKLCWGICFPVASCYQDPYPKFQAMPTLPGRRVFIHEHLNGTLILRIHNHLCMVARPCHCGSFLQGGPLFILII